MSYTIKHRTWAPADNQPAEEITQFVEHEQILGPFDLISQGWSNGSRIVYAHRGDGCTEFSHRPMDERAGEPQRRARLWVMNEAGATVATYDL